VSASTYQLHSPVASVQIKTKNFLFLNLVANMQRCDCYCHYCC